MSIQKSFINTSIFYNEVVWNSLLKECIQPLLIRLDVSDTFLIFLSYNRGEHVRFCVPALKNQTRSVASITQTFINRYLSGNPSPNREREGDTDKIFMDFPNNSLHFNLFDITDEKKILEYQKGRHISFDVSQLIIKILSDIEINDLILLSFSLYLNLSVLKAFSEVPNCIPLEIFLQTCNSRLTGLKPEDKIYLDNLMDKQRTFFHEIINEVFQPEKDVESQWIDDWTNQCVKPYITKNPVSVQDLIMIVNSHLSLDGHFQQLSSDYLLYHLFTLFA